MNILRVLIPTWRFFDETGSVANLYCKTKTTWVLVLKKPSRGLLNLFFNPEGNLYLAQQSLVENLMHDISLLPDSTDPELITQKVSYQLVNQLVKAQLPVGTKYQFKITVQTTQEKPYDAITSKELTV